MRRLILASAAALALLAASCGGGSQSRTVLVDFRNDDFSSFFWRYFPSVVDAHPGDTVVFNQQWTGEPHTVTFGRLFDRALPKLRAVERKYGNVTAQSPPSLLREAEEAFNRAIGSVPTFDPYTGAAAQNAEQPCYLARGRPPKDPRKPCVKREQPAFDGTQSYYSSGFIPPSGPAGNTYKVPLSDDIRPGTYHFYCVIHYPFMQGRLVVKPKSQKLRTQAQLNVRAHKEIEALASPLRRAYVQAKKGEVRTSGARLGLPLAGYHSGDEYTVQILEFVPRTITTRIGEPVTWTITGAHTVSFGVPRYFPVYLVSKDGTVRRNPKVDRAAGGSPQPPPVDFAKGPYEIDGGTYGGKGFYSSGLLGSEPYSKYTLRVSKPGRYRFACLVHPEMVGTLIVKS